MILVASAAYTSCCEKSPLLAFLYCAFCKSFVCSIVVMNDDGSQRCLAILCVVRIMHFGMKLYNDQHNAQVFNLLIYLFISALDVSGFLLAPLQWQMENFWDGTVQCTVPS
jgi:hypothetical protein